MFRLERGVPGFRYRDQPELPEVSIRRFRGACYDAAHPWVAFVEEGTEDRVGPGVFVDRPLPVEAGRRRRAPELSGGQKRCSSQRGQPQRAYPPFAFGTVCPCASCRPFVSC